ncbi:MAG: response regulator [Vibrionaceae bacterium]|nr:response regulator [Vibrionaceae bacterium]
MELKQKKILIVDDAPENIQVLMQLLKKDYKIIAATNGPKAIELAQKDPQPDLILLDIKMPDMDGYEVCEQLKGMPQTESIPIIFVSALSDEKDEYKGLSLGAEDYITKPFSPALVKTRVRNQLIVKQNKEDLERMVVERTQELQLTQAVMIESLGTLAEYRDPETGGHIKRTQNYVKALAKHLQKQGKFSDILTDDYIQLLYISSPLHDVGKVGVPDHILQKPGKLTEEEYEEMKRHTIYGYNTLKRAELRLGENAFIHIAKEIAYTHQEKWNGKGYPQGLKGEEIPLSGRLMAMADVYDALISKRVYKPPFTHEKAVEIITKGDNRTSPDDFDPTILQAFIELQDEFKRIALMHADFDEEKKLLSGN